MSPDLVDQAILACCKPQFLKVARIIVDVAKALKVQLPMERIFIAAPETFEKPIGLDVDLIADRIKALVEAGHLESQGNLDRWRNSEIRLLAPPAASERH
jgi:hypothetical protein